MIMRAPLERANWPVRSVFSLHGHDENDLSGGFAYALAMSPVLLRSVLADIEPKIRIDHTSPTVHLQTGRRSLGITDVEVRVPGQGFVVFEAKKGSHYPDIAQLRKYATVCRKSGVPHSHLIALTGFDTSTAPLPGS